MRAFLIASIRNRSYILDLLVALLLITTIYFLVGQKNQTEQLKTIANYNKTLSTQNRQILDRIMSCTNPDGACYQASQKSTGDAVANINTVSVTAAYCAKTTPNTATLQEFKKCIESQLKSK